MNLRRVWRYLLRQQSNLAKIKKRKPPILIYSTSRIMTKIDEMARTDENINRISQGIQKEHCHVMYEYLLDVVRREFY